MMAPIKQIVQFMETLDTALLADTFATENVLLIDSFPPYVFQGPGAGSKWAEGFIKHSKNFTDLRHTFGKPQEFSRTGKTVFYSQPITWEGVSNNKAFLETGGLALVLVSHEGRWCVQNYGWAVTSYALS